MTVSRSDLSHSVEDATRNSVEDTGRRCRGTVMRGDGGRSAWHLAEGIAVRCAEGTEVHCPEERWGRCTEELVALCCAEGIESAPEGTVGTEGTGG